MTDLSPPPVDELCTGLIERDYYMRLLGIELVTVSRGAATLRMLVRDHHINFNGTCHGGAIFSLADGAFGLASNSHGVLAAGIDTHTCFQAVAKLDDILFATASETSRSRRLAVYQVEVKNKEGTLIASFTGTVYITGKPNYDIKDTYDDKGTAS